jgi:hypothetical protein
MHVASAAPTLPLQVLSTQLSAAADEVAWLQAKLATQAEELRMLRANTQDNSGPLQAQLKELEGRLQAQAKVRQGWGVGLLGASKLSRAQHAVSYRVVWSQCF